MEALYRHEHGLLAAIRVWTWILREPKAKGTHGVAIKGWRKASNMEIFGMVSTEQLFKA